MAGNRQPRRIRLDRRTSPQLGSAFMFDQPVTECPPGRHQARIRIKIAKPDRRLGRTHRKRIKARNIDVMMRGLHENDVELVDKRRVNGPGISIVQKLANKAGKHRIINPHRQKDVGGKLRTGNVTLVDGGADHLGLVPERLEGAAGLIHDVAAGIGVTSRHQLCLDKPLFPVKPRRLIGKLVNHLRQILRTPGGGKPVKTPGHQCPVGPVCPVRPHRAPRHDIAGKP